MILFCRGMLGNLVLSPQIKTRARTHGGNLGLHYYENSDRSVVWRASGHTECHQVGGGIPLKDKETRVPRGQCFCWRQCLMFQRQSQNPSLVLQFPEATGYTASVSAAPSPRAVYVASL